MTYYLFGAIDWTAIESLVFVGGVLDLQAGFDVLDRGGDERDSEAGHESSDRVSRGGQPVGGLLHA